MHVVCGGGGRGRDARYLGRKVRGRVRREGWIAISVFDEHSKIS